MPTPVKQYALLGQFTCLAENCPDTCCRHWDMPVDRVRQALYEAKAPELVSAVDEARKVMKRDPMTDDCVQFQGGLCGIQKKYGTDFVGDACHFYPRLHRRLGESVVLSAALSCPETARLALFTDTPFTLDAHEASRLPVAVADTKPKEIATEDALKIIARVIAFAGDEQIAPERILARLLHLGQALQEVPVAEWQQGFEGLLAATETTLEPIEADASDPQAILYAFALLIATAPQNHRSRLQEIFTVMETALGCRMNWTTREIERDPATVSNYPHLLARWKTESLPVLRRWLQAQLAVMSFPFTGGKVGLFEQTAILAMRFATVRLALMCSAETGAPLAPEKVITIMQRIARFHDHLADAELSLRIYSDAKWLRTGRLRGLIGDI